MDRVGKMDKLIQNHNISAGASLLDGLSKNERTLGPDMSGITKPARKYKKGGTVKSKHGDGCCVKGKTKGRFV